MKYIKRIIVGLDSRQEANDVSDHQNDIGKDTHDRRVIYAGEGNPNDAATPEWAPLIFIAIALTEAAMKEIIDEFYEEVPIYFGDEDAQENA